MPIQIKELIIRATVEENAQHNSNPTEDGGPKKGKGQERLIRQCVEEVLEVLRIREEA